VSAHIHSSSDALRLFSDLLRRGTAIGIVQLGSSSMLRILGSVAVAGALLSSSAGDSAVSASDRCAALNYLLAQARTEFPSLRHSELESGHCSMAKQQFTCRWGFPGDRFDAAKEQAAILTQCIAAQRNAKPLGSKSGEAGFQINSETSAFVRGPEMDSGDWTLTLRILTTADWK
jgi:hypothetical protein